MASFKQFSAAYTIIALILGFVLVSSSVTAARVMDDDDCDYRGTCTNNQDCYSPCNNKKDAGGVCVPDPRRPLPVPNVCCCFQYGEDSV
ncbi:hypothetical protein MKW94_000098 [Papaver nudicaule]|uniref:Uncharacterized protein n=1 Tax=Papaver nudicaule TaxID=74823 RepID=A0AA41VTN4_PAPNU|nr:hypothetical protein [Papaver nudicaule]